MIYGNREKWESMPADAWPESIARQEAFNAKYRETGELLGAYGLADAVNAKLVRRADGLPAVTGGPYQETREDLARFWVLACDGDERGGPRHRRQPRAALSVRPPVAVRAERDRADVARGRGADHGADRRGVPGAGGHHGPAHQPRQADHQGQRSAIRDAGADGARHPPGYRAPRPAPDLQRGLRC